MSMPMFVSTKEDLITVTTKILHDIDPASTCCNLNEGMEDEYATEARMIAEYFISGGMILKRAMMRTFEEQFDDRFAFNETAFNKAYRKINEYLV